MKDIPDDAKTRIREFLENMKQLQRGEIIDILQSYIDNPQIALGLSTDPKTPSRIIEQIALCSKYSKARNTAITRMVSGEYVNYSQEAFQQLLDLWKQENPEIMKFGDCYSSEYEHTI